MRRSDDQEGGRVAASRAWPRATACAADWLVWASRISARDQRFRGCGAGARGDAGGLGVDVIARRSADLLLPETHDVIGDRAYAQDPELVGRLGQRNGGRTRDAGVTSIVKHIRGMAGRQRTVIWRCPRYTRIFNTLDATDFQAFKTTFNVPWAMVAHCVYTAIDRDGRLDLTRMH